MRTQDISQQKNMKTKKINQVFEKFPCDRKILDTLYAHYGKPENIIREKVKLFLSYTTPAGMSCGSWTREGYQLGRVDVFVGYKEHEDDLFEKTKIPSEGIGSWFIGLKENEIRVWISAELDATLTINSGEKKDEGIRD